MDFSWIQRRELGVRYNGRKHVDAVSDLSKVLRRRGRDHSREPAACEPTRPVQSKIHPDLPPATGGAVCSHAAVARQCVAIPAQSRTGGRDSCDLSGENARAARGPAGFRHGRRHWMLCGLCARFDGCDARGGRARHPVKLDHSGWRARRRLSHLERSLAKAEPTSAIPFHTHDHPNLSARPESFPPARRSPEKCHREDVARDGAQWTASLDFHRPIELGVEIRMEGIGGPVAVLIPSKVAETNASVTAALTNPGQYFELKEELQIPTWIYHQKTLSLPDKPLPEDVVSWVA